MTANQTASDPTNVGGKRVVAAIIDVGLGWLLYWILFFVLAEKVDTFGLFDPCGRSGVRNCLNLGDTNYTVSGGRSLLLNVVVLAYFVGVFVLQRGITGKTLGTMALGVVVVNQEGRPPGVGYALLRSVAGIVDYLPCCLPLVGLVTIFVTTGHRRVGDMAAKTFVIDKQHLGQAVVVPGLTPGASPYAQPYAGTDYTGTAYMGPNAPVPPGPPVPPGAPAPTGPTPTGPPPPTPPAAAGPTESEPQWDPQRNAYIQWDPTGQRWMIYDESLRQWRPID